MDSDNAGAAPNDLADRIIYEDQDVVAISKPAGLAVHSDGRTMEPTVVDWLLSYVPQAQGVGEPETAGLAMSIDRSGVVHRLDRDTSGVLLLTKHQAAHEFCKQQFHDRLTRKHYRAFVYGSMKESAGVIDRAIGRSAKDWRRRSAERGAKGTLRDAVTEWELIGTGEVSGERFSYLELRPRTGRTHQLRVHCKAIGHPIVHDTLYAGARLTQSSNLGFDTLALHAHILAIDLPHQSKMRLIAPVPQAFHEAADSIAAE